MYVYAFGRSLSRVYTSVVLFVGMEWRRKGGHDVIFIMPYASTCTFSILPRRLVERGAACSAAPAPREEFAVPDLFRKELCLSLIHI